MNDWSARDVQAGEVTVGLGPGEGEGLRDLARPVAGDPRRAPVQRRPASVAARVEVNGETVAECDAGGQHYGWQEIVAHAARDTRLRPGDVLGSGTLTGGCLLERLAAGETPAWIEPGDVGRDRGRCSRPPRDPGRLSAGSFLASRCAAAARTPSAVFGNPCAGSKTSSSRPQVSSSRRSRRTTGVATLGCRSNPSGESVTKDSPIRANFGSIRTPLVDPCLGPATSVRTGSYRRSRCSTNCKNGGYPTRASAFKAAPGPTRRPRRSVLEHDRGSAEPR